MQCHKGSLPAVNIIMTAYDTFLFFSLSRKGYTKECVTSRLSSMVFVRTMEIFICPYFKQHYFYEESAEVTTIKHLVCISLKINLCSCLFSPPTFVRSGRGLRIVMKSAKTNPLSLRCRFLGMRQICVRRSSAQCFHGTFYFSFFFCGLLEEILIFCQYPPWHMVPTIKSEYYVHDTKGQH